MGRRWGRTSDQGNDPVASAEVVDSQSSPAHHQPAAKQSTLTDPNDSATSGGYVGENIASRSRRSIGPFKVWYMEKGGQRHDSILRLDEQLPSPESCESEAATEYRLRLRAHYLRDVLGRTKEEVAKELGRAEGWVTRWWQTKPAEFQRPRDIPPYVADYNLRMLQMSQEPFRPAVLMRRYATDTVGLYEECAQQMPWRQAVFRRRNYETGEVTVTNIASSRQDCSYRTLQTGISRLDAVLDRVRHDFGIKDTGAYLLNNFYPDGNTSIAPHQHDFWSAILSFGTPRVFTVDGRAVLLGDGDLLVIGTQRHGVPKMPTVKDGRISVAIFWYPESVEDSHQHTDETRCESCGGMDGLQTFEDGMYCEQCTAIWLTETGGFGPGSQNDGGLASADDELLAAALELSLKDF